LSVVSLTVSDVPEVSLPDESDEPVEPDDVSSPALGDSDGVGLAVSSEPEPPVKIPVIVSPISSSRLPPLADAEGLDVAVSPDWSSPDLLADGDGVGSAASPEPESDDEEVPEPEDPEEDEPEVSEESAESEDPEPEESWSPSEADGLGFASSSLPVASALSEGDAEAPSRAATHSLYSSAVRLFDDVLAVLSLSATARLAVNPIPMRTAVGIAAMAIALPAGMWNLVNSGFLGAAWRGPVLTRDASTSVP
jgi:hypothetical protein